MREAFCMKCKMKKVFVKEPVYVEKQTSRGVKAFLNGECSFGHKMCLIVKLKGVDFENGN